MVEMVLEIDRGIVERTYVIADGVGGDLLDGGSGLSGLLKDQPFSRFPPFSILKLQ